MKKILVLCLALLALALAACGSPAPTAAETAVPADTPSAESTPVPTKEPAPVPTEALETAPEPTDETAAMAYDYVDVDLTQMSSTMVYSEIYNMISEPQFYEGMIVKMRGGFTAFETRDRVYFSCLIADAMACCAQGLEFELKGSYIYPDDYPETGSEITVVGIFTTYREEVNGSYYEYLILKDAVLL